MPTTNPRVKVNLTKAELERLRRQAKDGGETLSSLIRRKLGLSPLQHGGSKPRKPSQK